MSLLGEENWLAEKILGGEPPVGHVYLLERKYVVQRLLTVWIRFDFENLFCEMEGFDHE